MRTAVHTSLILLLIGSVCTPAVQGKWVRSKGKDFCSTFPTGWEADGRKLYTAIAPHGTWLLEGDTALSGPNATLPVASIPPQNVTWQLGKAGTHLKAGMAYPFAGKEVDAESFYVFCPDNPNEYHWVKAENGNHPGKSVSDWNTEETQMACRADWQGGKHPGKLVPASGGCVIGYGGGEVLARSYEVLVRE